MDADRGMREKRSDGKRARMRPRHTRETERHGPPDKIGLQVDGRAGQA